MVFAREMVNLSLMVYAEALHSLHIYSASIVSVISRTPGGHTSWYSSKIPSFALL
jgi:hypothetical protein